MRKIDTKTLRRFIIALEGMIGDMEAFGLSGRARELLASKAELEEAYRLYCLKIRELNEMISDYHVLFEGKHAEYIEANRIRQKESARLMREEALKDSESDIARYERKRIITA